MGLYVSFSGSLTYTNRKFDALCAVAAAIAGDRLLVETDSPYLTPHPLRGKQKRNEPANLPLTLRCLAHVRGQSPEELAAQTTANAAPPLPPAVKPAPSPCGAGPTDDLRCGSGLPTPEKGCYQRPILLVAPAV